jgi:hypothetical protein
MGHASPVYLSHLVNELRRNEGFRGLDKILGNSRKSQNLKRLRVVDPHPLKTAKGWGSRNCCRDQKFKIKRWASPP